MLGKIWQRYIFFDLIKCFGFFLLAFFALFMIADFSTHVQDFFENGQFSFLKVITYYLHQFFKRQPLLFPLALLISTIKVLSSLNVHRELVALQSCGLKLRTILSPFWILACFCCIAGYVNEETIVPKLAHYLEEAKLARSKNPLKQSKKRTFTVLYLKDSSRLIYQSFDQEKNAFFDVYWIRSFNDIWKMKHLNADPHKPIGEFVDHLSRNDKGFFEKKESYEQCILPSLKWKTSELYRKKTSFKHEKITKLANTLLKKEGISFHARGEASAYFFYKLIMPLMPFLVLLAVVPHLVTYSRNPPISLIYAISIFSFVVFFTLMDSLIIIAENQTLPPYIAIGSPFLLALGGCYWRFRLLFK